LPVSSHLSSAHSLERLASLAWLPTITTGLYYVFPASLQERLVVLFLPQIVAYVGLIFWARANNKIAERLGLKRDRLRQGLCWGIPTGFLLGFLNVSVILWVVPFLGGDIAFLRDTPHARMPVLIMLPWTIVVIAVLIELNFRGFLLGRLLALWRSSSLGGYDRAGAAVSIAGASLVFSYDPFMVATFKHLHWIALWDGVVWGTMRLRLNNLYAPIAAHAVEVVILYVVLKTVFQT
jgi:membrane protease YdiL (CAAX protease family)